jgi:hypothetical protein
MKSAETVLGVPGFVTKKSNTMDMPSMSMVFIVKCQALLTRCMYKLSSG